MTAQQLALKLFPGVTPEELVSNVTALSEDDAREALEQFRQNEGRLRGSLRAGFGHAVLLRKLGETEASNEALKAVVARAAADRSHPQGQAYARAAREMHGGMPMEEPPAPEPKADKRAPRERPAKERSFEPKMGQAQLSLTPGGVKLDEQRPELRRLRLMSPLKVELEAAEASPSFYVHAARDDKGIIQITPMHPFAEGDVIRVDVMNGQVLMGPWAIPVSEFAPGSSAAEGTARLVASGSGAGFRRWKVESTGAEGAKFEAYFAGLTKRGGAALRTLGGTNLVWDFEKDPPARVHPIALGSKVLFRYGQDGARLFAKEVESTSAAADAVVPEGAKLRDVLFPGVPDPAKDPEPKPAEPRAEKPRKEREESLSPSSAAHLVEAALLRGERGALEQLGLPRTSERGEQELFEKARWHLASSAGRSSTVTGLVVARAGAYRKLVGKRVPDSAAHGLVYLHTTAGEAAPLGGREKAPEDELSTALRNGPEGSVAAAVDAFFRRHTVLWDTTLALGTRGYRLVEVDVRRGVTGLVLAAPALEPSRFALAFVYEEGYETRERLETFLRRHQEKHEALAVVATRVGPVHTGNYGVLAARHGAAFFGGRYAPDEAALSALLASAKEFAGSVPAPVRGFPSRGKDVPEAQLVARPEVVAPLLGLLDAEPRPVALYALPGSGRTALARLVGLQGREPVVLDFRARARDLRDNPRGLIDEIRALAPKDRSHGALLVLDGIDFLAEVLRSGDAAVAAEFAVAISDAAASMRVLLLGLDPSALGRVLPGDNPLAGVTRFRLPLPSPAEAKELVQHIALGVRVDRALEDWVVVQSGGHPTVLRALLQEFADAQFGKGTARVAPKETLRFAPDVAEMLLSPAGAPRRAEVLASVLVVRESASPGVQDAVRLVTEVLRAPGETVSRDAVFEAGARLSLSAHPSIALDTALDWALLRETADGQITAGVPLLKTHLVLEES